MLDHKEAMEFKNIMKEMQTDGEVERLKQVKGEDGWENKWYHLYGYPCVTYTQVPGYQLDDQEMSRSIIITPRRDNDTAVDIFKSIREAIGSPLHIIMENKRAESQEVQKVVIALKQRMQDIVIYNPFRSFITKFLNESKYKKRDLDKYHGILHVITAINGYNRPLYDGKYLFTNSDDVRIFKELLTTYQMSINSNLSNPAVTIIEDIYQHQDEWLNFEDNDGYVDMDTPKGITPQDYINLSNTSLGKRAVQNFFSELNNGNYLKIVGTNGKANYYGLSGHTIIKSDTTIELSEQDIILLKMAYDVPQNVIDGLMVESTGSLTDIPDDSPYWYKLLDEQRPEVCACA